MINLLVEGRKKQRAKACVLLLSAGRRDTAYTVAAPRLCCNAETGEPA